MNIWNAERAFSGTSINTICATIRIIGALDVAALQKSLDLVVRNDEQIRARITVVNGKPCQYIAPYEPALFPVFDFTKTDSTGLLHWEDTIAREAISLIDAPLYDFRIFKQNESEGGIIVKTHHIISDGWSQVLLSNRIAETYLALISGREAKVEVGPSYGLHVEKEEKYLSSAAHEKDVAFWRERLAGFEGASTVKDCLSAVVSPVGRRKTFRLSHVLNHLIREFCAKYRVAPFAVYYMALAIYLNRTSGATRTAIGVPVFNRADYQDKNTLGMFVSTLPFLGEVDENWSIERFNTELAGQWFELLRHQRLPFAQINELSKEINPDAGGLFHIVLSYQTSRMYRSEDASVTFSGRWHYSGYQSEHLLIHLSSMEDDYRFSVDYDYLTQIFSERDIDKLHEYLTNILTAALSEPETPIWKLPMIGIEEKGRVLFAFNQTARPLPYPDAPSMLRSAQRAYAKRAAVICGGQRITYEALFALAHSYARAIDSLCPAGNQTVAICLEKGFPLAAAVLGATLSGNTWLTLSPDTPPGRFNEILENSGAAALILQPDGTPPGCKVPILTPGQAEAFDSAAYPEKPCADTAYMVYTSGSTGRPKGVLIGQTSLVNLAVATRKLYGHGAVLSLCSVGFDVFVLECAVALMNGRTIVFPEAGAQEDPVRLASLISGYAVGNLSLPPSRLEAYLACPEFARALCAVESIVCGGEHFPGELMQTLRQFTDADVYNQYGPSETTVAVSSKLLNDANAITIGGPMDNCRLYVLDSHLQPLPIGVYGEVYIGGLCVGQGYRNLPELTASRFIPSPFEMGETLYRSGDVGCWTGDGEIILGGRCDGQVKLRGLRIEPQEIAMRLAAHARVGQAAVKVINRGKGAFVAAYYTAEQEIPETELTEFLRSYLPAYMLPGTYVRLDALPVTRSGKIDYRALPEPVLTSGGVQAEGDAERALLSIFQRTLRHPEMDVESDYFLCGGDSLTAMEAIVAIEATLGIKLTVADLYAYRTARRIAAALPGGKAAPREARPAIPKEATRAAYPATATQLSLYIESQADPASLAYNMPGAVKLPKSVDKARLLAALRELVVREKLLRTGFELTGEGLCQRVRENAPFGMEVLAADSFEEAAKAFLRPFDVTRPPLMRAALWDAPEGDVYLFFDTHHIIGDGLTSPLMMKKLDALYAGKPYQMGVEFPDYALYRAKTPDAEDTLAYWKAQLHDAPAPLDIPYDRTSSARGPYPGKKLSFALPVEISVPAEKYCAANSVSPFMLFFSAFALLLHRLTGVKDMLVGTPVSGRTSAELWEVLGPFIRALPLRVKLAPDMSAARLVQEVRAGTLEMIEHQDISFDKLLALGRGGTEGGLFNALFSMRPVGENDFSLMGETLAPVAIDTGYVKFPLSLEAVREKGGYSFALEYASSLIDEASAALWAQSFRTLLESMLRDDEAALCDISPLDERASYEYFDRPDRLSSPFADVPLDFTIARAARRVPDAPAVRFHGEMTRYGALISRAQHIARALVSLGAKRGDVVGLAHARTPDMLAALIGIMHAGCVYMPALSAYPAGRLTYMAEAAKAKFMLADDGAAPYLAAMELPCPVYALNKLPDAPEAKLPALSERSGEDGIYVLFTSGTTGKPKGALNTHAAIANLLEAMTPIIGEESKNVLCATNITFDIFITESLLALALGKCVVLADEEEMLLPHKIAGLVEAENVTTAQLTPSRLQMCMGSEAFRKAAARLTSMILVGEPLTLHLAAQWREATGAALYNMYGPTEAAVYVSGVESSREKERITIGKPLQNCRVYVLDENLRRAMPTARGELYLAGVCLAKGYLNRPDLTETAFLPDPFFPGKRMYRSGDVGRLLPDGTVEFLGRRDSQVKINGQRVEPGEVTEALLGIPGVAEAATVAVRADNGEKRLRACVVRAQGGSMDEEELRAKLRAVLPPFMIPAQISFLEAMPRNASGKIDIQALLVADAAGAGAAEPEAATEADIKEEPTPAAEEIPQAAAPMQSAPVEETLARIWAQVLNKETIDPRASFFEQGGSSLSALDALSRCFNAGLGLTLAQFYANPTIEAQAALLAGLAPPRSTQLSFLEAPAWEDAAAGGNDRPKADASPDMVLLTGATGFLGAHLLNELAANMGRNVVCLVRGGDPKRLSRVMEDYFGADWYENNAARVSVVAGDMEKRDLGIGREELSALMDGVGTLVHCAADVRHFAADPEASMRANVAGTENAVRLAAKLGAGFAYISTTSVMGDFREGDFDEDSPPADPEAETNVYVKGKCEAELIVRRCAKLLPSVKTFRVGRLVGRNSDGVFQKNKEANAFYSFLRGALALEVYPEGAAELPVELTPVDDCARAIALLLDGRRSVYHVFNPVTVDFAELMHTLSDKKARFVTNEAFDTYLLSLMAKKPSAELVMLREIKEMFRTGAGSAGAARAKKTCAELREKGFVWRRADIQSALREYLSD